MEGQLVQFFKSSHLNFFPNDPVTKTASLDPRGHEFNLLDYRQAKEDSYLFIEAIMLQFTPDYSTPVSHGRQSGRYSRFIFSSAAGSFSRGVGVRGTVVELIIPEHRLDALEELHPPEATCGTGMTKLDMLLTCCGCMRVMILTAMLRIRRALCYGSQAMSEASKVEQIG